MIFLGTYLNVVQTTFQRDKNMSGHHMLTRSSLVSV